MTTTVEAIYQGGVFKPVEEVILPENQRVRLQVDPVPVTDFRAWLELSGDRRCVYTVSSSDERQPRHG